MGAVEAVAIFVANLICILPIPIAMIAVGTAYNNPTDCKLDAPLFLIIAGTTNLGKNISKS